jgi:flagellin-specific chaperone FliS
MPHKKFNQLQDKFFEVSRQMHEAENTSEKMTLLTKLQNILKESKAVLDEIHGRQARVAGSRLSVKKSSGSS